MDNIINLSRDDIKARRLKKQQSSVDEIKIPFIVIDKLCWEMELAESDYITAKDLSLYIADYLEG